MHSNDIGLQTSDRQQSATSAAITHRAVEFCFLYSLFYGVVSSGCLIRQDICTNVAVTCNSTLNLCSILSLRIVRYGLCLRVKSRNRPGVAQRVPGGLGSQIFMTFGT